MSPARTRSIITFYSYKGGVGRSMALANIAVRLAARHERKGGVVVIDWDLEAPGLHRYLGFRDKDLEDKPGLLDFLLTWKQSHNAKPPAEPVLEDLLLNCRIPESTLRKFSPELTPSMIRILPAGMLDKGYAKRLKQIDWQVFYRQEEGALAVESIREQLEELDGITLVDSRTGLSDVGGVCAIQLPDACVLMTAPNEQSADGIVRVAQSIARSQGEERFDRPIPARFLVVSRISELEEPTRAQQWLDNHQSWFEEGAKQGCWNRELHATGLRSFVLKNSARWSFEESIVPPGVGSDVDILDQGYNHISNELADWLSPINTILGPAVQLSAALDLGQAIADAEKQAEAARLRGDDSALWKAHIQIGDAYYRSGNTKEAYRNFSFALGDATAAADRLKQAIAHRMLGALHIQQNQLAQARSALTHAEGILSEAIVQNHDAEASILEFASVLTEQFRLASLEGRTAEAQVALQRAQDILKRFPESEEAKERLADLLSAHVQQARAGAPSKDDSWSSDGPPEARSALELHRRLSPAGTPPRFDVFFSYSADNGEQASAIVAAIEALGRTVWIAQRDLRPGDPWVEAISEAINACQSLVVLVGKRGSGWQRVEVDEFDARTRDITDRKTIPIWLTQVDPSWSTLSKRQGIIVGKRSPAEVAHDIVSALPTRRTPIATPTALGPNLLADYRAWVAKNNERLVPFFDGASERLLEEVCVELSLDTEQESQEKRKLTELERAQADERRQSRHLREVLLPPAEAKLPIPRLAILGDPGAGKTTLLRSFAYEQTRDPKATDRPIPIFVSLSPIDQPKGFDPIARVVDLWGSNKSQAEREALASELGKLAAKDSQIVLLLDGLDEVKPDVLPQMRERILWLAKHKDSPYAKCPIAVCSRPIGVAGEEMRRELPIARVRELNSTQQRSLLTRLLNAEDAAEAARALESNPSLRELARNPLMLTLVAVVARHSNLNQSKIPTTRVKLYGQAVELLLTRGYGVVQKSVLDVTSARRILAALALRLHQEGGETWPRLYLEETTWDVILEDTKLRERLTVVWKTATTFMTDIGYNSGIVSDHDGPSQPWRFLHRSLREFLAAEALRDLPKAKREEFFQKWKGEAEARAEAAKKAKSDDQRKAKLAQLPNPARWAEVVALLCGLVRDPTEPLEALKSVSPDVMLRALQSAETVPVAHSVMLLFTTDWNAWQLLKLLRSRRAPAEQARTELLNVLNQEMSNSVLGQAWWALESVGALSEPAAREEFRKAFFDQLRPKATQRPELQWITIPKGKFMMGSPEEEVGRSNRESPLHPVSVPQFQLAATTITRDQYCALDPDKKFTSWKLPKDEKEGDLPATDVSWWEAVLFCAWMGARLPSEAEWEYACRAGSQAPYSFHGGVAALGEHAWFRANSGPKPLDPNEADFDGARKAGCTPHSVGKKAPNAHGLFDMHGNVWEWCSDEWHDNYDGAPTDGSGWCGDASVVRVIRGGSFSFPARRARSAARYGNRASYGWHDVGFRPATSAPHN
ncbi:MAG: SUMF1/EgtB/PvdO family nonheme iron enzyme [Planctomycetes bacterium]|nr:SUMF1/EgtB/PvdO family nonheme iron enzyme [Planctomycetota bacterium]